MRNTLMKKPAYFKVDPKSVERLRVMAGADESWSDQDPDESLIAFGDSGANFKKIERVAPKSRMLNNVHEL